MERVKLYCLKKDDEWDDSGTGYITFDTHNTEKSSFVLMSEDSATLLLEHEISVPGVEYILQEDGRIIRWTDPDHDRQYALSFEHEEHCRRIYDKLQRLTGKVDGTADDALPELTMGSLETMAKMFEDVQPFAREQWLSRYRSSDLVPQLVDVFRQCEDLDDVTGLEHCCRLARILVLHADISTAEVLFSETYALDIIGALEYDPDIPVRIKHRQFLKEKVVFKQVVPIKNREVIGRIHQIYRMQYVKDVVLPRLMDEPVYTCLSHMIMMGHIEVVNALSIQPTFFSDLFGKIREADVGSREWRDLVGFLQEYCLLIRQLQPANQQGILIKMDKMGLFSVLTEILKEGDAEVRVKAIDILNSSMTQDPRALRTYITRTNKHPLCQLLVDNLIKGHVMGLTEHSLEVIKALLESNEELHNNYEAFLEIFYGKFMQQLVDALATDAVDVDADAKGAILELLCFCVQTHSHTIKYCILRGNIMDRVMGLLSVSEKWLVSSAVRCIRTLVGMKEEFYDRIIVRSGVFAHVVGVFFQNGDRNNLLNSTILELFDFIRREHRHVLIEHIMEKHHSELKTVGYVSTFEGIKNEYDKRKEGDGMDDVSMMTVSQGRMKRDSRAMEKEEEEYFAEGSDDTPDISQGSRMDVEESTEQGTSPSKRFKSDEGNMSYQRDQRQETLTNEHSL